MAATVERGAQTARDGGVTTTITENEYLREALRYPCHCPLLNTWQLGCTLCAPGGFGSADHVHRMRIRHELVKRYAYAIPNDDALAAIAAWGPVVEIGAGTGYWAHLIAVHGVDVVAYDEKPGRNGWCDATPYYQIAIGGPAAVRLHADRTLFLCWPPMSRMAARSLWLYRGPLLVYIGEGSGGCTADDRFFRPLDVNWK